MSEINIEISVEIPTNSPFKKAQKEQIMNDLTECLKKQSSSVKLKDAYYVEKRAAEFGDVFKTVFELGIMSINGAAALLWMFNLILKMNPNNIISIKKKNGKEVRLFEGMTEEEVRKILED